MDRVISFTEDAQNLKEKVLSLSVPNFRVRQFLSREIHKKFQFGFFKIEFNKDSDIFTVSKLHTNEETGTPISLASFNVIICDFILAAEC